MALVPCPNFNRAMGQAFLSYERPFVVILPVHKPAAALVPNLGLGSWVQIGLDGAIFDWRDRAGDNSAGGDCATNPFCHA